MKKIKSFLHRYGSFLKNMNKPEVIYPKQQTGGLKIHLGAGPINIQGWVNVDARDDDHVHLVAKGFELAEFSDGTISEIYMCHVLEHFSFSEAEEVLKNLMAKLRVDGVIRLSVPDFDKLIEVYLENDKDLDSIKLAIMGGQEYEFNFHKSIYNHGNLTRLLKECGYVDVVSWDTETDFGIDLGDWSSKTLRSGSGRKMISLNLKAKKK